MSSSSLSDDDGSFQYVTTFDPVPEKYLPGWMLKERTRMLTDTSIMPPPPPSTTDDDSTKAGRSVVYWMQRDVRTLDNWALLYAQFLAQQYKVPLHVMHVIPPPPPSSSASESHDDDEGNTETTAPGPLVHLRMTERYGHFLLGGLQCVHDELAKHNVQLHIVRPPSAGHAIVAQSIHRQVLQHIQPLIIICDMSPIRHVRQWMESPTMRNQNLNGGTIPLWQVDAHNVVPVWYASPKREVGARTLRPKLHRLVQDCLQSSEYKNGIIPNFIGNDHMKGKQDFTTATTTKFDYDLYAKFLQWDDNVGKVDWATPGTDGAIQRYNEFVTIGLPKFDQLRNDPNMGNEICSKLSPWLNCGHVSFATILRMLAGHNRDASGKASFIEEGFVRKELTDNFLWYTPELYDQLGAAADWAQQTLAVHATDPREYVYTLSQLEQGETHDDLWNASQLQVVQTGKLHGFLRMYWAKKILEWTASPQQALDYAQYFNDYYALDGRDPNGFVGVGWSIMGIHDQGWKEREVFGKIRFMNYKGCQRKFDVAGFVAKYPPALENALKSSSGGNSDSISKGKVGGAAGTKRKSATAAGSNGKKKKTAKS